MYMSSKYLLKFFKVKLVLRPWEVRGSLHTFQLHDGRSETTSLQYFNSEVIHITIGSTVCSTVSSTVGRTIGSTVGHIVERTV